MKPTLMTLHKSEQQGGARPLPRSLNRPPILPSSVPDNGAWIQTTGLLSLVSGYFWANKMKIERDHENYVISFTDGSIKIGSTKRHTKRMREVVKKKIKNSDIRVVTYYLSNLRSKEDAYRVERDTCYLLSYRAIGNAREWLKAKSDDIRSEANFVKMTMEMFAHGVGLTRSGNKYGS